MIKEAGIYFIECLSNNKKYVGSSHDMRKRFFGHHRELESNRHTNHKLQSDYNLYGEELIVFTIVEVLRGSSDYELQQREQYWIEKVGNVYNIMDAFRTDIEAKNKVSQKLSGKNNPMFDVKGESHPNTNLTLKECKEIAHYLKTTKATLKVKTEHLLKTYKTSPSTIRKINFGTHWSNKGEYNNETIS